MVVQKTILAAAPVGLLLLLLLLGGQNKAATALKCRPPSPVHSSPQAHANAKGLAASLQLVMKASPRPPPLAAPPSSRRAALSAAGAAFFAATTTSSRSAAVALERAEPAGSVPGQALSADKMPMPGLSAEQSRDYGKPRMSYPDFKAFPSGLQVKDVKEGSGDPARVGDRVVISWEGYTIGYYGRPFEKKNSVQGGAFDADQDFYRFVIGKGTAIPGLEEGLTGMRMGGVRQIIIPPELGYPESDRSHEKVRGERGEGPD